MRYAIDTTPGGSRSTRNGDMKHSNGRAVPAQGAHRRGIHLVLAALALVATAACEGENLFTGDSPALEPRIVDVAVPQTVFAGDTVRVRVTAAAARRVTQVLVSVRGAVRADTVVEATSFQQQFSTVVAFPIPALLQDTLLVVQAQASDAFGALSRTKEAVALAFGPPVVTALSGPTGVRAGERISIDVRAFGARRIARLDLSARGAITTDTSIVLSSPQFSVAETIRLQIPNAVDDTLIVLNVLAQDQGGATSAPRSAVVPFAIDTPTIAVIVPPSVQAGRVLNLGVLAQSIRHIAEVRIEIRGGATADLVMRMTPTRARTLEFISWPLPSNLATPELRIRAFALDRANTLSATGVHTVSAPQGAPSVVLVDPWASTVSAGEFVDVRVQAISDRPVKEIWVRWRGFQAKALASVLGGPETRMIINPPRTSVLEDVVVESPCVRSDAVFMMLVTARDVDEALSPIATGTINVSGNQLCTEPVDSIPSPDTTTAGPGVRTRVPAAVERRSAGALEGRGFSLQLDYGMAWPTGTPLPARFQTMFQRGRRRGPRRAAA